MSYGLFENDQKHYVGNERKKANHKSGRTLETLCCLSFWLEGYLFPKLCHVVCIAAFRIYHVALDVHFLLRILWFIYFYCDVHDKNLCTEILITISDWFRQFENYMSNLYKYTYSFKMFHYYAYLKISK